MASLTAFLCGLLSVLGFGQLKIGRAEKINCHACSTSHVTNECYTSPWNITAYNAVVVCDLAQGKVCYTENNYFNENQQVWSFARGCIPAAADRCVITSGLNTCYTFCTTAYCNTDIPWPSTVPRPGIKHPPPTRPQHPTTEHPSNHTRRPTPARPVAIAAHTYPSLVTMVTLVLTGFYGHSP